MRFAYQTREEVEVFRRQAARYADRINSKAAAIRELQCLGIAAQDGELSPEYGGLPRNE